MHQFELISARSYINPHILVKIQKLKELIEKNYIHTSISGEKVSCDGLQQLALSNLDILDKVIYSLENALHRTSKDHLIMELIDKGYFTTLEDGTVVFDPLPHNGSFHANELRAIADYLVNKNSETKQ